MLVKKPLGHQEVSMFSILSHFIFGNSHVFSSPNSDGAGAGASGDPQNQQQHHQTRSSLRSGLWKDKNLSFDLRSHDLELSRGEQLIGCFYPIEDVKGNQDELGLLKVTNLRLVWICSRKRRVNLSIGWRTVSLVYEQNLKDAMGQSRASLVLLTKYETTKYEFVFNKQPQSVLVDASQLDGTGLVTSGVALEQLKRFYTENPNHLSHLSADYLDDPFEVVFKVWQAYKQSQLFRHCRTNLANLVALASDQRSRVAPTKALGPITISDLNRLPGEEVMELFAGVNHCESRSTRYAGTLMVSNIRIIWVDDSLPMRNMSIPYIRVDSIKLKQCEKILISTQDYLGRNNWADFRIQKGMNLGANKRTIKAIYETLISFYTLSKGEPRFGPESSDDSQMFMSHLRPVGLLLNLNEMPTTQRLEDFGPPVIVATTSGRDDETIISNNPLDPGTRLRDNAKYEREHEESVEEDLSSYGRNLTSYWNDQSSKRGADLIFSSDLGLAIERPRNGEKGLQSIWRIEI